MTNSVAARKRKMQVPIALQPNCEAQVWIAISEDIPGLVAEASTPAAMREKLICRVPELLKLNEHLTNSP